VRILHVLHHSLPQATGYALRSHRILVFQAGLGFEVAAVTSGRDTAAADQPRQDHDGVPYYRTRCAGGLAAATVSTARRVAQVARSFAPDIIHCHSPWLCALAGLFAARRTAVPLVYEIRDFWEDAAVAIGKFGPRSPQYLAARAADGFALKRAHRIVTISHAQRQDLLDRGIAPAKVVVAANGVDGERFAPRPRPIELLRRHGLEGARVVGYIGSLMPYEGLAVLIRAFPLIRESCPRARLMIVGGGDEQAGLSRLAADAGIGDIAVFTGRVAHDQILDYYAALDLLVYPRISNRTTRLTTPLKPLEAMAMAKPVVASDLPALREIVRPGETGVLCAPGDPRALAHACLGLLRDPERSARIGAAARASVLEARSWRQTLAVYPQLYGELLGAAAPAAAQRI
jgi:PEP-CTERM/exosortase A-associated glycosyltransferase